MESGACVGHASLPEIDDMLSHSCVFSQTFLSWWKGTPSLAERIIEEGSVYDHVARRIGLPSLVGMSLSRISMEWLRVERAPKRVRIVGKMCIPAIAPPERLASVGDTPQAKTPSPQPRSSPQAKTPPPPPRSLPPSSSPPRTPALAVERARTPPAAAQAGAGTALALRALAQSDMGAVIIVFKTCA